MTLERDELLSILSLVCNTAETEIDCDQVIERVAAYLDSVGSDVDPATFADLRQHLRICPECLEEFEALVDAHVGEEGAPPDSES